MAVHVDDETRDRLIELAGGERKIGEYLNKLTAEEYARQVASLSSLYGAVTELELKMYSVEKRTEALTAALARKFGDKKHFGRALYTLAKADSACPFCGGQIKTLQHGYDSVDELQETLGCEVCGCTFGTKAAEEFDLSFVGAGS